MCYIYIAGDSKSDFMLIQDNIVSAGKVQQPPSCGTSTTPGGGGSGSCAFIGCGTASNANNACQCDKGCIGTGDCTFAAV